MALALGRALDHVPHHVDHRVARPDPEPRRSLRRTGRLLKQDEPPEVETRAAVQTLEGLEPVFLGHRRKGRRKRARTLPADERTFLNQKLHGSPERAERYASSSASTDSVGSLSPGCQSPCRSLSTSTFLTCS